MPECLKKPVPKQSYPFIVEPAVCSRHVEAAVEEEEEIAQVASTLARANESRSLIARMKLIKEGELYLSVNLPG
jgi:hypothetical protein